MAHNTRKFAGNSSTFWRHFHFSSLFGPNGPRHRIPRKNSVSNAPFPPRAAQSPPLPRRKRDFYLDFRPNPSCRFSMKKYIEKSVAVFCVFVFFELFGPNGHQESRSPENFSMDTLVFVASRPILAHFGPDTCFLEFRRNPNCRFSRFFKNKGLQQ